MSGIVPELFDVTLNAHNLDELGRFYAKLGLRQAIDDHDLKVFILGVNELEIRADAAPQAEPATIRIGVKQLEPVARTLEQHAIDFQRPRHEDNPDSVLVYDPNGNLVQFVEQPSP
jgi:catechol-2,3-dioxygenase